MASNFVFSPLEFVSIQQEAASAKQWSGNYSNSGGDFFVCPKSHKAATTKHTPSSTIDDLTKKFHSILETTSLCYCYKGYVHWEYVFGQLQQGGSYVKAMFLSAYRRIQWCCMGTVEGEKCRGTLWSIMSLHPRHLAQSHPWPLGTQMVQVLVSTTTTKNIIFVKMNNVKHPIFGAAKCKNHPVYWFNLSPSHSLEPMALGV